MKPFLKWAGNKFRVINQIAPHLITGEHLPAAQRLIEPFTGSGALFLNSDYAAYQLGDSNVDLITLYQILQREGDGFIEYCRTFFTPENNDPDRYYAFRTQFNTIAPSREKAALFLYMNKHGYNGLCRYNKKGGFNVPFGRYKRPYFPEKEMHYFYEKAKTAVFSPTSFAETMQTAVVNDIIYCDPPYVPLSTTANFTSYGAAPFGMAEQQQLATLARTTADRGIPVLISNHDTPITRQLYADANAIHSFKVARLISCDGEKRTAVDELLAIFR